jgi:hypothetical protein
MRGLASVTFGLVLSSFLWLGVSAAGAASAAVPNTPGAGGYVGTLRDGGKQSGSEAGAAAGGVAHLLPCPLSVPCRAVSQAEEDDDSFDELVPPGTVRERPTPPTGGTDAKLLPCPQSIPCLAPAGPIDLQEQEGSDQVDRLPQSSTKRATIAPSRHVLTRMTEKSLPAATAPGIGRHEAAIPARADVRGNAKREVLMAGTRSSEDSARSAIAEAASELTQVNPATLNPDNRPTYEEASEFVAQGRAALQAHDNSAALTLGEKARRLMSGLKPAQPVGSGANPPP